MQVFLFLSSAVVVASQLVGDTRDPHGCIPTAGYVWCESKAKCHRPWMESCPQATPPAPLTTVTGTYKDVHNCLAPAGYQWCESKKKCYRDFEEDCPTTTQAPTTVAASNVPKSCTLWNDGCNSCLANSGVLGGCTEMACFTKGTPYCSHYKDGMTCKGVHKCSPPMDCVAFYDGCNSCGATNGKTTFCSMMYCMPEYTRQPYCTKFKDGRECQGVDSCLAAPLVVKG